MSTASYIPACSAAQNADLGIQLGYIKGNKLQFAAEQSKIIYDLCLQQISACQLPARCIRLFNTILNQTVGYQKLEDHATTTRLQELTKIRHDHIGEAIRYLSRANIIKWRQGGKYNNYLSINFNFSTWFDKDSQCSINNDPTLLLPEYYRRPIDEGLGADFMQDNSLEAEEFNQLPPVNKTVNTPTTSDKALADSSKNSLDKASIIQIVKEVVKQQFQNHQAVQSIQIETKSSEQPQNNQVDESKNHQVKVEKSEPTKSDSVDKSQIHQVKAEKSEPTESDPIDKKPKQDTALEVQESHDIDTEKDQQLAQYKAELEQSKANQAILEQQLFERLEYGKIQAANLQNSQQKTEQIQSKYERLQAKDINHHVNTQPNNNVQNPVNSTLSNLSLEELANLDYPSQLTPEERASIQTAVGRAGSREQDILNLLIIRLSNGNTPPNNNVSYLASLVNRHRRGELDFSALSSFKSPKAVRDDKALKEKLGLMVDEYHEYDIKRRHYEKGIKKSNINGQVVLSGSDFDKEHYQNFYNLAYKAYHQIKAYVKDNQLDESLVAHL